VKLAVGKSKRKKVKEQIQMKGLRKKRKIKKSQKAKKR